MDDAIRKIELPRILDARGNLSFIEGEKHVPFDIKRTYWIYDVPGGETRGGHAYRTLQEFVVAISGSFDLVLDDGTTRTVHALNRSYNGIYVPSMVWRSLENFSTNALCLVLASDVYREDDYIREYAAYKAGANAYLPKQERLPILPGLIRMAMETPRSFFTCRDGKVLNTRPMRPDERLTTAEVEILRHIVLGMSVTQIARKLLRSKKTVSTHKRRAMGKLGLSDDLSLALYLRDKFGQPLDV